MTAYWIVFAIMFLLQFIKVNTPKEYLWRLIISFIPLFIFAAFRVNFGYDYVETIAKAFFGIEDVQCIKAECLDVHNANVNEILNQAKHSLAL